MHYFVKGGYDSFTFNDECPNGRPLIDKEGELYLSTIWEGNVKNKLECNKMMRKLDVGEWIVYEDMGAYRALSSAFNYSQTPIFVISECLWKHFTMKGINSQDD